MSNEFNFYGLSIPWFLLLSMFSLLTSRAISYALARKGLYRHIWHPPLFDCSLFVIVLGVYFTLYSATRF